MAQYWVSEHRRWIEEHGGNVSGYVQLYGSKRDALHYGAGGEAIYAADVAALDQALKRLHAAQERIRTNKIREEMTVNEGKGWPRGKGWGMVMR